MHIVATKGKSINTSCSGIGKQSFANSRVINISKASFHFQTFFRQLSVKKWPDAEIPGDFKKLL